MPQKISGGHDDDKRRGQGLFDALVCSQLIATAGAVNLGVATRAQNPTPVSNHGEGAPEEWQNCGAASQSERGRSPKSQKILRISRTVNWLLRPESINQT